MDNSIKPEIRLVLLRSLNELPGYRSNSSILQRLVESWGISVSRDQIKTELHWLAEQGYIEIELNNPDAIVVRLSERGQDVAEGRLKAHGIQRPSA